MVRPVAVRLEISQAVAPDNTGGAAGAGTSSAGAASSMMTWALVPLMPNEETPARRGRPSACHGRASARSRTFPADQSMVPAGSSACRLRGSSSCWRASTIFITPAAPAAAWVWARFDFTEPSHTGRSAGRSRP